MDPYLGAYSLEGNELWVESTRYVTSKLIDKLRNKAQATSREYSSETMDKLKEFEGVLNTLASLEDSATIQDSHMKPLPREVYDKRLKALLNNPIIKENFDGSNILI